MGLGVKAWGGGGQGPGQSPPPTETRAWARVSPEIRQGQGLGGGGVPSRRREYAGCVHTWWPFEEGILQAWRGGLGVHPLGSG